MAIRTELDKFKEKDIYSLLLFALYKISECPEYASLSELAFILDKDNFLRLCEYYGGCTITIPTIEEIEYLVDALLLYKYVAIDKIKEDEAILKIVTKSSDIKKVKKLYIQIKDILNNYKFKHDD